ncbi:MAG TPA: Gfo/Idh/MocA family oxidoreductase [Terriglobia bacterium]|nr:Gfo/Idh/MocA family oxidoreductase [Terriglobia bacterium]
MSSLVPSVGVAGCGYWGKNLVRNFHQLGALRAVCDSDTERAQELGVKYGVEAVSEFDKLLDSLDLKAIAIAAPAVMHFELARRALLAGKDVFVEKPLALSVDQAQELIELASHFKRILMVGHLLQYHPAILELKRLVTGGELGKIQYVCSNRLNLGKLRTEENILWSFAPHDVSAILALLGELPENVAAHGSSHLTPSVVDVTTTHFQFASGAAAHIFVSWLHPFKEQKLVVVGDRAMAVFDDTQSERKLVIYHHHIDWLNRMPVAQKADGEVIPLPAQEPLEAECRHFLECVLDRKSPRTDGREGLRVLRVLDACEKSLRGGGRLLTMEQPKPKALYFAHPSAVIDEPCDIGEKTRIWHFSHIMAGSKLGKHCNLGQNVVVSPGCRIGNNVKIQNNVSIYTGVELEDDVFCGPSMVFTNVINPRSHIERKHEYRRTLVRKGASLGANSTVVCGATIGAYAFVAAGAVVTHDVADYALVMGVPARQAGWVCKCGIRLELAGESGRCSDCGESYILDQGYLREQSAMEICA